MPQPPHCSPGVRFQRLGPFRVERTRPDIKNEPRAPGEFLTRAFGAEWGPTPISYMGRPAQALNLGSPAPEADAPSIRHGLRINHAASDSARAIVSENRRALL